MFKNNNIQELHEKSVIEIMSTQVVIKVYSILHALSSPASLPPDTVEDIPYPEMNNSL